MSRTRVRCRRVVVAIVAVATTATVGSRAVARDAGERRWQAAAGLTDIHAVKPGETVWGIARSVVGPEGDPRPVVDAIVEANGLPTGDVQAGALLRVPVRAGD